MALECVRAARASEDSQALILRQTRLEKKRTTAKQRGLSLRASGTLL